MGGPAGMPSIERDLDYRFPAASTEPMAQGTPSLLTAALPSSIQSRLPFISSIRKTVASQITSSWRLEGSTARCSQATTLEVEETIENRAPANDRYRNRSRPHTPPSSVEDSPESVSRSSSPSEEMMRQDPRQFKRRSLEYPCRGYGGNGASNSAVGVSMKSASGVDWKYGSHGLRFLEVAVAEAALKDTAYESDANFERQAYIDGVIYALRGLPPDLDDAEVLALRRSSPDQVKLLGPGTAAPTSRGNDKRPLPQRLTQWLVMRVFILLSYVVPTIVFLLDIFVQLDKKFKIPETVVTGSIWLAGKVHRRTVGAYLAFCSIDDGRVGQAMGDGAAYLVDSVTRGVRDGISEGIGVLKN